MNDLTEVWKKVAGKDAIGEVVLGYKTDIQSEGCCELCYSDVATIEFYLLNNGERIRVSRNALGIVEVW